MSENEGEWFWPGNVCERGHTIAANASNSAAGGDAFCGTCGSASVRACQSCGASLRGALGLPGTLYDRNTSFPDYSPPNYCWKCGQAHPWMERRLQAIAEIAKEETDLSDAERDELIEAVSRFADEQPTAETHVAMSRFRRLTARVGGHAEAAIVSVATQIASAAVRTQLGL